MNQETLVLHDDVRIGSLILPFIPTAGCAIGDYIDYSDFLEGDALATWQEGVLENKVCQISEREVTLNAGGERLTLYVGFK